MISRRRFLQNLLGVVAGAGLVGLPVWEWVGERRRVDRFARRMMGTDVEIVLVGLDPDVAAAAAEQAFGTMKTVADRLTVFDANSALSRFNASAGSGPIRIPRDLEEVLTQAVSFGDQTNGAFTPAIAPLSRLWAPTRTTLPARPLVEEAVDAVRQARLRIPAPGWAELASPAGLDLGGVAKGYAVDRAVATLRSMGATTGIVDAGGDLRVLGTREGRPWRVGIPDPHRPQRIARILELVDAAVATSGDYQRFFVVNGVRYHHIVDPRTGYPATGTRSFTVVLPDGMSADAASTAGFVLGPESGRDFVAGLGGEALVLDATGTWSQTDGLRLAAL